MKYFAAGAIVLVAAAVIGGFFVIGSPAHARAERFDQQRLEDIQTIQNVVSNYFSANKKLPQSLRQIADYEGIVPTDPETGTAYTYMAQSSNQFQVCANFALASDQENDVMLPVTAPVPAPYGAAAPAIASTTPGEWQHAAGNACFIFTVAAAVQA